MNDSPLQWALAPNPSPMTLDGTRTYIVGRERPVVIDPGPSIAAHLAEVARRLGRRTPSALILTHSHADHSAGATELARMLDAPLWMAPGAIGAEALSASVDYWCHDGDTLGTDAGELRLIATPGHAPEHLCVHWSGAGAPAGGAVFVGDLLLGAGDTTLIAPPDGNVGRYLESLERIAALQPGILFPAHGDPLADPVEAIDRYRDHRVSRVQQVRALSNAGVHDAGTLVQRIYGTDLHPDLRRAANGSVQAMIQYLRRLESV